MPTEEEMSAPLYHPAEESPQGPIPTGPEFRAMRLLLGLSLVELAGRACLRVHQLAAVESRPAPLADALEAVLHVVLLKSGVRWSPHLAEHLALVRDPGRDVQDRADLLDRTGSADLANLDAMVGPTVEVRDVAGGIGLRGAGVDVHLAFPVDLEEFWVVVEDVARGHR